jgi:hypothetical protein
MNQRMLLYRTVLSLAGILTLLVGPARAQTTMTTTTWRGHAAYRLSDGKTEAIIVPDLSSRILFYGFVGGKNVLYNAPTNQTFKTGEWKNWGGSKVWPALQSDWPMFSPAWPPNPTYDSMRHRAEPLPGGRLRTVGPVMVGFGVRATREFSFDKASGAFVVTTTFTKETGEPRKVAIWNVTQIPQPDAIYIPANPESAYRDGVFWFGPRMPKEAVKPEVTAEGLLCYTPTVAGGYKIGTDAAVQTVVGVRGDLAFVLHAKKENLPYPEGAEGAGFPVTIWNAGGDNAATRYNEMEMMSPITALKRGDKLTHILRWQLVRLPNKDAKSAESRAAIAHLIEGQ